MAASQIESFESSKVAWHRARMSGGFDSRKDRHSTKFKGRSWIFVKLNSRELHDSKLCGLHPFDDMAIINWVKDRSQTER